MLPVLASAASKVRIEARFKPEPGFISDATMLSSGRVGLLYPDMGHIAEYSFDGRLYQHTVREAGVDLPFRPTCCVAGPADDLLVFDEVEGLLFEIEPDGNFSKGVKLAYEPTQGKPLALTSVGDLAWQPKIVNGNALPPSKGYLVWAMLPHLNSFACFNSAGAQLNSLDFADLLPYPSALCSRAQWTDNAALYLLDYSQGAILYRNSGEDQFRRLRPSKLDLGTGVDGIPSMQDFAVDGRGRIIAATHDSDKPLLLLSPGAKGYDSRKLDLKLPVGEHRIAVRYGRGRFVLWLRDTPYVTVVRLE